MPSHQPVEDAWLVTQAAAGDQRAFRMLYRAYVRPVYWLAHGLVGSVADAEDVTQETFVVAWRKIPELVLQGESLLPWLATVCRFQAANRMRALRRERERSAGVADESIVATVDVEKQVVDTLLVERILRQVEGLADLDRAIFRLCASDGFTYAAAAEELGVTPGVVRNRLSRIRTRLRTTAEEGS